MPEEISWTISNGTSDDVKKVPYIGTYKVFVKSASPEEIEKSWNEMRSELIKAGLMEPK